MERTKADRASIDGAVMVQAMRHFHGILSDNLKNTKRKPKAKGKK